MTPEETHYIIDAFKTQQHNNLKLVAAIKALETEIIQLIKDVMELQIELAVLKQKRD